MSLNTFDMPNKSGMYSGGFEQVMKTNSVVESVILCVLLLQNQRGRAANEETNRDHIPGLRLGCCTFSSRGNAKSDSSEESGKFGVLLCA